MINTNVISWIGSVLLAVCGVPEMLRTIKDKRCHIGYGMLLCWFFGEVLVFIHVFNTLHDKALLFNYGLNLAILCIMLYYKLRPKKPIPNWIIETNKRMSPRIINEKE